MKKKKIGWSSRVRALRSRWVSIPDGDRLILLSDGSWAAMEYDVQDAQGEPVQYLTLPGGRRIRYRYAVSRGWVQP